MESGKHCRRKFRIHPNHKVDAENIGRATEEKYGRARAIYLFGSLSPNMILT
jgi:hypothetical protein